MKGKRVATYLACLAVLSVGSAALGSVQEPQQPLNPKSIPKYVDQLPAPGKLFGPAQSITMSEFTQQVLPAGFPATMVWGYNGSYPGPTIEAVRGVPTTVTYYNNLVDPVLQRHMTIDQTLHWADPLGLQCMMSADRDDCFSPYAGPVPTVVHLHGGEVPSRFDGGPQGWFTPNLAQVGATFPGTVYTYPNGQEATTLWYHDHALGTTRTNVYGGLAAFYLLRDPVNEPANLPSGPYEREIAIQDRQFDTAGQLLFPDGSPAGLNGPPTNPEDHPYWNPEFFGDVIVVNGKTWPFLNVEPRRYRLRLLNGSNARFYTLSWSAQKGKAPVFWQIGTDGGLLDTPVKLAALTLAPGERADVIVDFSGMAAGSELILQNSAKAPFPAGTVPDPATLGQIMKVVVALPLSGMDTSLDPSAVTALRPTPIVRLAPTVTASTPVRRLTLNEVMGMGGPMEVLLNNSHFMDPVSEKPRVGSTEVWEIINTTGDTHPIHLHLVQYQLLSRQKYQAGKYLKDYERAFPGGAFIPAAGPPPGGNPDPAPYLVGKPSPPDLNEAGWKDTVRMNPGEVTRIAVRFAPTDTPAGAAGPGYPFDATEGPGYVWHCHILDHEDNDMMRPFQVVP
ncbi:multicopper oxidase [Geomonas sp. RF6]|uniref:multicopper oxidase family protein n=1 Tax=Geomonas sp. RF6 TaxID=2897342 RepID=UPI001E412BFE|nr:multicopper oxidase [Geomonas sp. RF6]UFS68863.1 multicopper oxidase [Geomonas sp. RF6]